MACGKQTFLSEDMEHTSHLKKSDKHHQNLKVQIIKVIFKKMKKTKGNIYTPYTHTQEYTPFTSHTDHRLQRKNPENILTSL